MTTDSPALPEMPAIELTLPIEGMTCASCSNRVERFLRKTDGVRRGERQPRNRAGARPLRSDAGRARRAAHARSRRPATTCALKLRPMTPRRSTPPRRLTPSAARRETRRLGLGGGRRAIVAGAAMMAATLWLTPLIPLEQLNLAAARAGDARPVRARPALLRRGRARGAPRQREHEHARRPRHDARRGSTRRS